MRSLKPNERLINVYERFILIEVLCPKNRSYRTTIDKWEARETEKLEGHNPDERLDNNYWKRI